MFFGEAGYGPLVAPGSIISGCHKSDGEAFD